jgi:hypothetical protein
LATVDDKTNKDFTFFSEGLFTCRSERDKEETYGRFLPKNVSSHCFNAEKNSMKFLFNDYPYHVPLRIYENAIHGMVEKLRRREGIISIFQIGSTLHPGISDIDMVVVFKDNGAFHLNPLEGLSKTERYLFIHPPFGVSKSDFIEAQRYTFSKNWRHLWGEKFTIGQYDLSEEEIKCLKTQTALEYLIQNYINLTILRAYRIFSVRALLLNMKAMLYDLQLLSVLSGRLYELLETLVEWRNNWFEIKPNTKHLSGWIHGCYQELHAFLKIFLRTEKFYLPECGSFHITKNVTLMPSEEFFCIHKGIILPALFSCLGKKYFKIQRRLNQFFFHLPIQKGKVPPVLAKRFELEYRMVRFNRDKDFMPLRSSLNFFRKIQFHET